MTARRVTLGVTLALLPVLAFGQAAQTTTSFAYIYTRSGAGGEKQTLMAQMILCDLSGNIPDGTPADPRVGGETCVSGDWTEAVDCRGAQTVTMQVNEFGGGSGSVILWNVQPALGTAANPPFAARDIPTLSNLGLPGVEAPGGTPSAADPDPLAVNLNISGGVTTTVDGTTTRALSVSDRAFDYLVAEVDDCTGECDMRVTLRCDW